MKILKKILILSALIFISSNAYALDLSRVKSWSASEILTASDLNAEFNNILNHPITNNDIGASAGIVGSKLDLTSVGGEIGTTSADAGAFTTLTLSSTLDVTGITEINDKLAFTQDDQNEYIDSLADGYLDLEATTGIRLRINTTEQVNLIDGVLAPTTDNDIDLGASGTEFKDLYIDGTANIDSLVADTADINAGTIGGVTLDGSLTISIGSDADGDIYYRSSNVLTRLAKGTARQLLRMNSGATAPEWSSSQFVEVFTTTGSPHSWTAPTGVTFISVTACAGGGGGGSNIIGNQGSGGGGGGQCVSGAILPVTPTSSYTFTVGAGGIAGTGSGSGGTGGTTSLTNDGDTLSLTGGGGGTGGSNGGGGSGASAQTTLAGSGSSNSAFYKFGGGNGAAGSDSSYGGAGGSSHLGLGANGGTGSSGNVGQGPGGGGSGSYNAGSAGVGAAGLIVIKYNVPS